MTFEQPQAQRRGTAHERGYTYRWQQYTKDFLQDHPLCQRCLDMGLVEAASVVDHIIPVQGPQDPLFWEASNHQALSARCHSRKTREDTQKGLTRTPQGPLCREAIERKLPAGLQPPILPVVLVCGPPASGKSTYVRLHAGPQDVVIDTGSILATLSGLPEHEAGKEWLVPAMEERHRQLHALATDHAHVRAWVTLSTPSPIERRTWATLLHAEVVLLHTPIAECMRRIQKDPSRVKHFHSMVDALRAWREQ